MKSVFTKTWIQSVALLCLAFVAIAIIAGNALESSDFEDFRLDATTDSELIAYRMAVHNVADWEDLLADYKTEYTLRIGGVLPALDDDWQRDSKNPSLYTNAIDSDPWESAWQIPGTTQYLWLIDDGDSLQLLDIVDIFTPFALVFLIVAVSLYLLSRKIAGPIRQLARSSQALAEGESGVRAGGSYDEPFGSLARNFDNMADRIERLFSDQRILIGALSHELRGPVSRLRFALDMTRSVESLPEMRKRIASLDTYLTDLEQLLEQTLLLTRLRQQGNTVTWAAFDMQQVINEAISKFHQHHLTVTVDYRAPQMVYGSEGLIRLALSNLISNATRYARSSIIVSIKPDQSLADEPARLRLTIEDDGDGVSTEHREQLFVPFSRTDESRSRESGGLGLGLSLVELIARQHDGTVGYFTSSTNGAGFEFCWPALIESDLIKSELNQSQAAQSSRS